MRRTILFFAIVLLCASVALAQTGAPVKIIKPTKMDVSAPLSEMVKKSQARGEFRGQEREIPNIFTSGSKRSSKTGQELNTPDPLLQNQPVNGTNAVTVALNFAGASNNDNQSVVGFRVAPPDPNMDVGPNHIVQTVNLVTTIWSKSGTVLMSPFATSDLWSGFGGPCEFNNDGDPIVLYDHLADRWVISQFVFSTDECVCVSTGSDPTGTYNRYQFTTPGNDYPKLGVMGDAYYATLRNFDGTFNMDAAAMDRAKMLVGDPSATIQIFNLSALNPDVEGFIPADLDGPAPPAGTPGFIVGHNGGPTLVHNELEVYKLTADFTPPITSSLSLASIIPVPQFDLTVTSVPQPSPGSNLDALAQFTMHRATVRDFGSGSNFRMALTHTVDATGSNRAGVRWYEIRDNTRTGNNWTLFQSGTYSPDATHRWMPSIAMNANGDIGLSYTVSSSSVFPSIRAAGRLAADPLGTLQSEVTVVAGTGSQTQTGRWGDYSALAVDPSNNTTFIGNHEYVITTGSFNWWTRIFSFNVTAGGGACSNIALNRPATASSSSGPNAPSRAVDGNLSTFWRSSNGTPQWIQVDLGTGKTYGQTTLRWDGTRYALSYEIRVSNSSTGTPFTTVFSTTTGNGGDDIINFANRTEQFIRLHVTQWNSQHGRLNEFEVCGAPASAPKQNTGEVEVTEANAPEEFQLHQNYPNPFNPTTRISYTIPRDMHVTLKIYNLKGEEIRTLVDGYRNAGSYEVQWDGRQNSGNRVASGVYLYQLKGDGVSEVRRMMLLQ